jgi:hypothetical protein
VTKLKVQVLPCVIAFVDGIGIDRIVGFEGLGHGDNFTPKDLEARLLQAGVLVRAKTTKDDEWRRIQFAKKKEAQENEDDGWDD